MDSLYLEIMNKRKQIEIVNIKKCNEYTSKYGITLSDNQIINILERRKETLKETGRVELREGRILWFTIYKSRELCTNYIWINRYILWI